MDTSGDNGRVDWVCGEATCKNLEHAYSKLSERNYGREIKELKEKQKTEFAEFKKSLKR